jgi:hypothetical protein
MVMDVSDEYKLKIRQEFGKKLSDAQVLEIYQSLFYLGRAIDKYYRNRNSSHTAR